ncbi:MAG: LysR family transcriptional regulator [Roseibium sp.]|uniref:LysR family transcriptional regulator n=1 Tax=Roseibium sp. TaxID=1936156 RepID=UPI003D9C5217
MIELRLWRSVLILSEELHFRRAAARLNITQPALTKQIQDIEGRLGVSLFERLDRQVRMTAQAEVIIDDIRRLIDSAERLEAKLKSSEMGSAMTIRVGSLEYIAKRFLPEALTAFAAAHPDSHVEIDDMTPAETIGALMEGRVDLGLVVVPVEEPSLVVRKMLKGRWSLVVPAGHRLAVADTIPVKELANEPLVFFARRVNPDLYDSLKYKFSAAGVTPRIAYHTQDPQMGPDLVAKGVGLFVVADYAMSGDLGENLVMRPLSGFDADVSFGAAWRQGTMTPTLRSFVDLLPKV